jgi:hypothetical protein
MIEVEGTRQEVLPNTLRDAGDGGVGLRWRGAMQP